MVGLRNYQQPVYTGGRAKDLSATLHIKGCW